MIWSKTVSHVSAKNVKGRTDQKTHGPNLFFRSHKQIRKPKLILALVKSRHDIHGVTYLILVLVKSRHDRPSKTNCSFSLSHLSHFYLPPVALQSINRTARKHCNNKVKRKNTKTLLWGLAQKSLLKTQTFAIDLLTWHVCVVQGKNV